MLLEGSCKIPCLCQCADQGSLAHAAGADNCDEFSHLNILPRELFGREEHLNHVIASDPGLPKGSVAISLQ